MTGTNGDHGDFEPERRLHLAPDANTNTDGSDHGVTESIARLAITCVLIALFLAYLCFNFDPGDLGRSVADALK